MQRELYEGEEVLLLLDPNDLGVTPGMMKWNECSFRISKAVYSTDRGNPAGRNGIIYFELEGCVSEYGVPYSIVRDWIVPVRSLASVSTVCRTGGVK